MYSIHLLWYHFHWLSVPSFLPHLYSDSQCFLYSTLLVRLFTELCLFLIEFLISLISRHFLIFLFIYWIPFPYPMLISFSISCFYSSTAHEVCVSNVFEHIQCSVVTPALSFPMVGSWDTEALRSQVSFWNSILLFVAPFKCNVPVWNANLPAP